MFFLVKDVKMQENHDESPANDIVDNTPKVQELGGLGLVGGAHRLQFWL